MIDRPRRLRRTPAIRALVRETRLFPDMFIAPRFVREDIDAPAALTLLEGHAQETVPSLVERTERQLEAGCRSVILFGIPARKDEEGSEAWNDSGIVQEGVKSLKKKFGADLFVSTDLCLDEYTSHGHCGVLTRDGDVDNDPTLELYARAAVSQARAGSDCIAPSGMMDGQVAAIREALDDAGFENIPIMAYSAKFASVLYGPFREAAGSAPKFGNRESYQMQPGNRREALREAALDCEEGADIVMVKPASFYLDVLADIAAAADRPVAAYQVSGEWSMIHEAARAGAFDEGRAMMESLTAIARAGADIIISYYAVEACQRLRSTGG